MRASGKVPMDEAEQKYMGPQLHLGTTTGNTCAHIFGLPTFWKMNWICGT